MGVSPWGLPGPSCAAAAAAFAASGGGGPSGPGAVSYAGQRPARSVGHGDGGIFEGGLGCTEGGCRSQDSGVYTLEQRGKCKQDVQFPGKDSVHLLPGVGGKWCL